jgi:hypothetical protein
VAVVQHHGQTVEMMMVTVENGLIDVLPGVAAVVEKLTVACGFHIRVDERRVVGPFLDQLVNLSGVGCTPTRCLMIGEQFGHVENLAVSSECLHHLMGDHTGDETGTVTMACPGQRAGVHTIGESAIVGAGLCGNQRTQLLDVSSACGTGHLTSAP